MDIVSNIRSIWNIKYLNTSNNVFKMHGKFTVMLALVFTLLVSARQYFGDSPINCFVSDSEIKSLLENFCWIVGTYTNKHGFNDEQLLFGMGAAIAEKDRYYQKYYQWVVFVFILQALLFYFPSYLWGVWEAGRLKMLCENLSAPLVTENWNDKRRNYLLQYLLSNNKRVHTVYALRFFFCEVLNFIIVLGNIVVFNYLFPDFWFGYAPAVSAIMSADFEAWTTTSSKFFPKVAKCDYKNYGPSGSVQIKDAMCILPLNILNEKLFAFLWVYLLVLALISGFNIIYRLFTLMSYRFRQHLVMSQLANYKHMQRVFKKCRHIGDWFIIYQLSRNLNPVIFVDLMLEMSTIEQRKYYIDSEDRERIV